MSSSTFDHQGLGLGIWIKRKANFSSVSVSFSFCSSNFGHKGRQKSISLNMNNLAVFQDRSLIFFLNLGYFCLLISLVMSI